MNLIIKGFIIGIGKIIPGVSGAMIAMLLNEYDNIIDSIANIKKDTYNKTKYLSKIGLGIISAIIIMSKIIVKSISKHYFATMLLFAGIIIGGILETLKKIKPKKKDIIISILILLLIYIIITKLRIRKYNYGQNKLKHFIIIIIMGIMDAISSIIPGISGTAILMYFGYYNEIIETFSTITNISMIEKNIKIMLPFIIGFIIGTIIISKILDKIIKKHPNIVNITITIFMIYTIIILIKNAAYTKPQCNEITLGLILLIITAALSIRKVIKTNNKNIFK